MQTQLMHTAALVDWTGSRLHIDSHDMYQMQLENSLKWNSCRPIRDASSSNQLQEPSSLKCVHSFEVQEELGFLPEIPP